MSSSKRKPPAVLARPVVKASAKAHVRTNVDETRTAVKTGNAHPASSEVVTVEISSDSNDDVVSDSEESSDEEGRDVAKATAPNRQQSVEKNTPPPDSKRVNGASKDVSDEAEMLSPEDEQEGDASDAEASLPTFGDLIRGTTTIEVPSTLTAQQATPLSTSQPKALVALPSANSLGTVLNQALRTNDNDLLEACLLHNDYVVVTNTINRMESALAGQLLGKLAARMHKRPGRALGLMRWIQGTLIAHGGALASQGDLMRKLADLSMVLEERSRGLTSLLALKGKLDLLDAQMKMRETNAGRGRKRKFDSDMPDEKEPRLDKEEGIIYVEGEEDEDDGGRANGLDATGQQRGLDEKDDFLATNGVASNSDDDSSDEEDDDMEDFEEAALDGDDEVDHDDVEEESGEDESDGDEPLPPAKVQRVSSVFKRK